jgi:ABC-type sugar transport system ATPase subunit
MNDENAISVSGSVKTFGKTRALGGLDLSVRNGEVHGFLGPNGAGKSTTLRVLLGLIRKDSGEASLLGGDPWREAVALHRRLAYVPGDVTLWPGLTGGDVIDLGRELGRVLAAAAAHLPAVWVLVGISAALFGGPPRFAASVGSAVLAACALLEEFGRPLQVSN